MTIVKVLWKKENCSRNLVLFKTETPSTLCSVLKWHCVKLDTMCTHSCRVFTVVLAHDSFELPFFFLNFFLPRLAVGRHKDTSTHVRALDNFDLSRTDRLGYSTSLFGALFFISFYAYWRLWCFRCLFFFCVDWVSGACFFVINGLKVAHHSFIHDRCESSACQCVGCLSFFLQISCWYHHWMSW